MSPKRTKKRTGIDKLKFGKGFIVSDFRLRYFKNEFLNALQDCISPWRYMNIFLIWRYAILRGLAPVHRYKSLQILDIKVLHFPALSTKMRAESACLSPLSFSHLFPLSIFRSIFLNDYYLNHWNTFET